MGKSRRQVRIFLKDHSLVNSVGNAYADEILFEVGIHPKQRCNTLSEAERIRLLEAIGVVMRRKIDAVELADRGIEVKVRDDTQVRNRKNQPCFISSQLIARLRQWNFR